MHCPYCDREVEDDTIICPHCGKNLGYSDENNSKKMVKNTVFGNDNVVTRPKFGDIYQNQKNIHYHIHKDVKYDEQTPSREDIFEKQPAYAHVNDNPRQKAEEYSRIFIPKNSKGNIEMGKSLLKKFPGSSFLFSLTLPSDFTEKSSVVDVNEEIGYRYSIRSQKYHITKKNDEIKISKYNKLIAKSYSPPIDLKNGSYTWIEKEGTLIRCPKCHGRGTIICPNCNGRRERRCPTCGGRGFNRCSDGYDYWEENCSTCGSSGFLTCQYCHGRGEIKCSKCDGYGELRDAEIINMKYWVDNEPYHSKLNIPDKIIKKANGIKKYNQSFDKKHLPMSQNVDHTSRCDLDGIGFKFYEIIVTNQTFKTYRCYTIYYGKNGAN